MFSEIVFVQQKNPTAERRGPGQLPADSCHGLLFCFSLPRPTQKPHSCSSFTKYLFDYNWASCVWDLQGTTMATRI